MSDPDFNLLDSQLRVLLGDETDALANVSNFIALLYNAIDDIHWTGIYVLRDNELVLGPFQGKPACVRISVGSGVCGTAAATLETQRVADVHQFDGHIACDPDSRSELVVPLLTNGELIGVLDIDSASPDRFSAADQAGVERLCESFCEIQGRRSRFI
ncbi:MAG: GAF domain-containing protein [Proteobacteria bacterium]|nr:GAF domain-containing protein [Pseudomonadota bacterium]